MKTARVLTWNLWWRFGDWRRRMDAIAAVLAEVEPDICCFQEVWSTDREDAAAQLGDQIGLSHVARSYADDPQRWQERVGQPGVEFGNAVVSRWPLADTRVLRLPGSEGRTALAVCAMADGAVLPVICTHLTAHPAASGERCEQVAAIVEFVVELGRAAMPPIIAGDLNAEPDSDEVRLLGGCKTVPAVPGVFFVDAWRYADDGQPGWTWRRDNPHVPVGYAINGRIDYVHIGEAGPNGEGAVQAIELAGGRPVDGTWPSDHLAVVADIAIPE